MEEHLDALQKDISHQFDESGQRIPPKAKYFNNRDNKPITVTFDFQTGYIPKVKVIASRKRWLAFLDIQEPTFETIQPYLSKRTPRKTVTELQRYAAEDPNGFAEEFCWCVMSANSVNPLYQPARKQRGGSPYARSWLQMWKIRYAARDLYLWLEYHIKFDDEPIENLLRAYDLEQPDVYRPDELTKAIIERHFDFEMQHQLGTSDEDIDTVGSFFRRYVRFQPLSTFKYHPRIISGDTPHLKGILRRA